MNIPNSLTVSRLVAIPLLMALVLLRFPGHDQVAAALFIVFSLTDTLDGQVAPSLAGLWQLERAEIAR